MTTGFPPNRTTYPLASKNPTFRPVRVRIGPQTGQVADLTVEDALQLRDSINAALGDIATDLSGVVSTQVAPAHPRCPAHGVYCTGDDCCCADKHKEAK